MKILLGTLLLMLTLTACATVHTGDYGEAVGPDRVQGLKISAKELSDPSEESFSMISMTFENESPAWLKIDKVEILIDEAYANTVSVVVGQDLQSWASAMEARERLAKQNHKAEQLGLTLVGVTAAAIGAGSHNRGLEDIGLLTTAGAGAWMLGEDFHRWYTTAQAPKAVPSDYVTQPFSVPGKMFLRRWLLLNKPVGQRVSVLLIKVTTVDGRSEKMAIKME